MSNNNPAIRIEDCSTGQLPDLVNEIMERFLGSSWSKRATTGNIKNKSDGFAFNNTGITVIISDSSRQDMNRHIDEKFKEMSGLIASDQKALLEIATDTFISKAAKVFGDIISKKCKTTCEKTEDIKLTLDDIKDGVGGISSSIGNIVLSAKDDVSAAINQLEAEGAKIKAELANTKQMCEHIVQYSHMTHELCEKTFGKIGKIEDLLNGIFGKDGVFEKTMDLAEKRYELAMSALSKASNSKAANVMPAGFDSRDMMAMFSWIKGIPGDIAHNQAQIEDLIKERNIFLDGQLKAIGENIDNIDKKCDTLLRGESEILGLGSQILQRMTSDDTEILNIVKQILQCIATGDNKSLTMMNQIAEVVNSNASDLNSIRSLCEFLVQHVKEKVDLSEACKKEYNDKIDQMKAIQARLEEALIVARANWKNIMDICPYCGRKEARTILGGDCRCNVCGQRFTWIKDVDPNMNGKTLSEETEEGLKSKRAEDAKKGQAWRTRHTARLEKVFSRKGDGFYRMKIEPYTVSSKGVLIIPSCDTAPKITEDDKKNWHKGNRIAQINFCEPNTDDEESWKALKERPVKTLLLPSSVTTIGEYNGYKPFSDMKKLEGVYIYNADNAATPAPELFKTITGRDMLIDSQPQNGVEDA